MTNKNYTLFIIAFLMFNISSTPIQSQTIIESDILYGSLTNESSPYIINKFITVPKDSILTIEAGCKIIFQDKAYLLVNGRISAVGTKSQNIELKGGGKWDYQPIYLSYHQYKNERFASSFKYCKIDSLASILARHDVIIDSCLFKNCQLGIYLEEGTIQVRNSVFHDNYIPLRLQGMSSVNNCLFYNNENNHRRGGVIEIYAFGESKFSLKNNTIVDNKSKAIYIEYSNGEIEICNSIIRNNSGSIIQNNFHDVVNVRHSNIEGGWKGEGNIDEDPLFVDPQNGNYHLSWSGYPINDNSKSKCIDAGDPFSGEDSDGSVSDIGALSYFQEDFEKIPMAYFSADTNFISIGETVMFNNNSLFLEKQYTCFWDFGDGNTSSDKNPSHTYYTQGSFDVSLFITNSNGNLNKLIYEDYISVVTEINDEIVNGTWSKEKSPYLIKHNIEIQENNQLIVEAGVRAIFGKDVKMNINGQLLCNGTPTERISFISTDRYWDLKPEKLNWLGWKGIVFGENNDQATASTLSYTDIQYTKNYNTTWANNYYSAIMIKNYNGIKIEYSNITNCLTTNRNYYDDRYAGGITCIDSKNVTIKNCHFENCKSEYGGAIYATNSDLLIDSCSFLQNGALNGTSIFLEQCDFSFMNNFVSKNNYFSIEPNNVSSCGTIAVRSSNGKILGNIIDNNYNKNEGGISCRGSNLTISSNYISNNSSKYSSSGIFSENDSLIIVNNVINNNRQGTGTSQWGGGMFISDSPLCYIVNNTITNNFAVEGGGGIYLSLSDKVVTKNNIIFNNKPNNYQEYKKYSGSQSEYIFSNNYLNDPHFLSYETNDFDILSSSPCIDSGDTNIDDFEFPFQDIIGNQRISNLIDIGAYEYQEINTGLNSARLEDEQIFSLLLTKGNIYLKSNFTSSEIYTISLWDIYGRKIMSLNQRINTHLLWITSVRKTPSLSILTAEKNGKVIWSEKIIR
ncbi:right-handed parallel beta-helix repeat-containing protein [Sunxiuqinia elliptica]|uniref:Parallel beta-helix repeat protein n=1 Tax=Sunxiuqinia elliptica TaxID=655355 RepID=A0A4R6GT00_9BACT|nr:right-handed parallel beta-helix repeat-containing protein [Sunxiuqinia elliptica]TDN98317.1 parallel beta-helix repeat protein [Sunxiuqinia elliptica]TDO60422.1 parallel beta-helix repeat protein [Sunxiuqinia elliptica]